MLRWQLAGMPFVAVVLMTTIVFQAVGEGFGALVLSLSRQGLVFAAVLVILGKTWGYQGVIAAQAAADLLTAILAFFLLKRKTVVAF